MEKDIEEMAKVMLPQNEGDWPLSWEKAVHLANKLYKDGYRKVDIQKEQK